MALLPWGALCGGNFKTKEQRESKGGRNVAPASDVQINVSEVMEAIAKRKGSVLTSIALAYVMHQISYVFPIRGGQTVERLKINIDALGIHLRQDDMDEIEAAVPFGLGFPHNFALAQPISDMRLDPPIRFCTEWPADSFWCKRRHPSR